MKLQTITMGVLLLTALTTNAAQQTINSADNVGVQRGKTNSNFTDLYTLVNGAPWLAQTTAPNTHNVFWIDTSGTSRTIKYWDGDSWEVAASGVDGTYTLPTASAETKGGVRIGARLTMTDDILSADAQIPVGGEGQVPVYDTTGTSLIPTTVLPITVAEVAELFTGATGALCKDGTAGNCGISSGSFTLDTFPAYSDSAHSSGFAVNSTHLAVYSAGAGEWGLVPLTFSLSPTPVLYTLTVSDPGSGNKITNSDSDLTTAIDCGDGATACTSTVVNGASLTGFTGVPATDQDFVSWGGAITSTENPTTTPYTVTGNFTVSSVFESNGLAEATYTINTSYATTVALNNTRLLGQTWTVPTGGGGQIAGIKLYSIDLVTAGTVTCRVGNSASQLNMSSNYASGSVVINANGEVTVPITGGPTLVEGESRSVVCQTSDASLNFRMSATDVYAGGSKYSTTATDWDMTGHIYTAQDLYFKYMVLQ